MPRPIRLAYLVSHPIQYQAPLLRFLARQPELRLKVFFMSDFSTRRYQDPGFGVPVQWDVPLLEGYDSEFLPSAWQAGAVGWSLPAYGLRKRLTRAFDALWVHGYAHVATLRAIFHARRAGLKVLLRGESTLDSHERGPVRRAIKTALLPRLFASVDAFLAIGRANREYYRHYGVSDSRIFDMPYAVDNEFFRARAAAAAAQREALRRELNLAPDRPVILYAAKFQPRKRPGDLWEAYRQLSADGTREPTPYLLFVGDGELRPALEAAVKATGWSSVRFLGFRNQTEMPALYDLCDVFVLPSQHEPWGLALNEVMNAGRPVIGTQEVGAAADLVTQGQTGFTYAVGDIAALAGHLRSLTADRERARAIGEAARQRVERYSFEADWRGLRAALEQVCG